MQEIQTYFLSAVLGCSVQIISLLMGIQIFSKGIFSKLYLIILFLILLISGLLLLYYVQYYSLVFTMCVLIFAIRYKKRHVAIVAEFAICMPDLPRCSGFFHKFFGTHAISLNCRRKHF